MPKNRKPKTRRRPRTNRKSGRHFINPLTAIGGLLATPFSFFTSFLHTGLVYLHFSGGKNSYLVDFLAWIKTAFTGTPFESVVDQLVSFLVLNLDKFAGFLVLTLSVFVVRPQHRLELLLIAAGVIWFAPVLKPAVYLLGALILVLYHLAANNNVRLAVIGVGLLVFVSQYPGFSISKSGTEPSDTPK